MDPGVYAGKIVGKIIQKKNNRVSWQQGSPQKYIFLSDHDGEGREGKNLPTLQGGVAGADRVRQFLWYNNDRKQIGDPGEFL